MLTQNDLIKPVLKVPFPSTPEIWTCPKTGIKVPKRPQDNLAWRLKLLKNAEKDVGLQKDLMAACTESTLFWVNAFVWTYHDKDINPLTFKEEPAKLAHNPFITWEIQDELFAALEFAILNGEDILVDKCRQMGASWCCVIIFNKFFLFRENSHFMEFSRIEDYVDKAGEPKSLFWKHDYVNRWLPEWMCPPGVQWGGKNRRKLRIDNILNGSMIIGESTTGEAGSGATAMALLLDEFAKVKDGGAMASATADVAPCRIVNSTPAGPGTAYSKWKHGGKIKVFIMPFWEHPLKGKDRRVIQDEITGKYDIMSPYREHEETRRTKKQVAQEMLRQDIESGGPFFDLTSIEKHIARFGKNPLSHWDIRFRKNTSNDGIKKIVKTRDIKTVSYKKTNKGPLSLWTHLIEDRPDQSKTYRFGIDLGKGQGASPSVISIKCIETNTKIGEWWDRNTPPYEMARIAVALAIWVGGRNPHRLPVMKWEMNGPGWDFGRLIVNIFGYPYYYRQKTEGEISERSTRKYGWHASSKSKYNLLSLYDRLLAQGGYINPSVSALEEMKLYVEGDNQKIYPTELVDADESELRTHGDRVIADALTLNERDCDRRTAKKKVAPRGSFGYRQEMALRKKKLLKTKRGRTFNFSDVSLY